MQWQGPGDVTGHMKGSMGFGHAWVLVIREIPGRTTLEGRGR